MNERLPLSDANWQRTQTARRLLAIEHADGRIEDCGFVQVLVLHVFGGLDPDARYRSVIEWKDENGVPHTAFISEDDYDEDGRLLNTILVPLDNGETDIWHFDEEALIKLREHYREGA